MSKTGLVMPAIVIAMLSACVASEALASPGDAVLGKWRGTDSPTKCPMTALTITADSFTMVQDGVAHKFGVLGIGLQGNQPNEVNVMTSHENVFHVIDRNHIQLYTPFAQCSYARGG